MPNSTPQQPTTCAVRVTPKSGQDRVTGISVSDDGTREVCVRVTAPPEGGKANKAVCRLVASQLGVSKSAVSVKRGGTSHHKLLQIDCPPQVYESWLASLPELP